ncbi:MAG: DNA methyltransferase [Erysipelotrichaceae bacterium]
MPTSEERIVNLKKIEMQTTLFENKIKQDYSKKEISHKAKSYTGLYAMHKYWGKKPFNIMADFIKKYTLPDEIVLDPFCGSGVSVTEAVFNRRKGVGIDINPISILITKNIIQNIDLKLVLNEFNKIEAKVKDKIQELYVVERNGQKYEGQNFLWENGELTEVRYSNGTRKRYADVPNQKDIEKAFEISYNKIDTFFPRENFFHNSRINANRENQTSDLFTPRNLLALSLIYQEIENITNNQIKDFFKFCFTASMGQSSKMVFVIKRRNKTKENGSTKISEKKEIGSWVIGYWMPNDYFENNAWTCFENRFKKIFKAKKEQSKLGQNYRQGDHFEALDKTDFILVKSPSQDYLKSLPENSIDYILTDPPHGNRIPYLELSLLWNSWLKENVDYEKEIIISESKDRKKDKNNYNTLMYSVFKECYRVLKPEKKLSFMFNSLDDDAWISSVEMFRSIGYKLELVETLGYSANSVVQDNRKNSLQTDFIITYSKPLRPIITDRLEIIRFSEYPDLIMKISELKKKDYKPYQIMNHIMKELLSQDKFLNVSELIKEIDNA